MTTMILMLMPVENTNTLHQFVRTVFFLAKNVHALLYIQQTSSFAQ